MREPWVQVRLSDLVEEHDESYGSYYNLSKALRLKKLRANMFRFSPGQKMEYHSHTEQEELFFILEGQCTLVVDGERKALAVDHQRALTLQNEEQLLLLGVRVILHLLSRAETEHVRPEFLQTECFGEVVIRTIRLVMFLDQV